MINSFPRTAAQNPISGKLRGGHRRPAGSGRSFGTKHDPPLVLDLTTNLVKFTPIHCVIVALFLLSLGCPIPAWAKRNDPVAGHWNWAEGVNVELSEDGQAHLRMVAFGMEGKWTLASAGDGGRKYVIVWQNGLWIDQFSLSSDSRHLVGQNQIGVKINASRVLESGPNARLEKRATANTAGGETSPVPGASHALPPGVKVMGAEVVNITPDMAEGDIQVRLSDGRTELWTKQGQCSMPKVSGKGDVGWVLSVKPNASGHRMDKDVLCVQSAKGKRRALPPNAYGPFIEEWAFIDRDSAIVIKSRGNHGGASFMKYDFAVGRLLDHVDCGVPTDQMPQWGRPYADQ
jgi:hypothetical protein